MLKAAAFIAGVAAVRAWASSKREAREHDDEKAKASKREIADLRDDLHRMKDEDEPDLDAIDALVRKIARLEGGE